MYLFTIYANCKLAAQIRFLGDATGKFSEALDVLFDSTAVFGNKRSKRYALVVDGGKVKDAYVEPDNTGVNGTDTCFLYYCGWQSTYR